MDRLGLMRPNQLKTEPDKCALEVEISANEINAS